MLLHYSVDFKPKFSLKTTPSSKLNRNFNKAKFGSPRVLCMFTKSTFLSKD